MTQKKSADLHALEKRVAELTEAAKEAEELKEHLKVSEERYRNAFEHTGTAMMVLDGDMTLLMANHRCEEVSGYPQLMASSGRKWTEFVADQDLERMIEEGGGDIAELSRFTLHEVGLEGLLKFAKAIGALPPKVILIGCKPKALSPTLELSPEVEDALHMAADMAIATVEDFLTE